MDDLLEGPLQECEAAALVAAARVDRLLGEVFEDGNRARRVTRTMIKTHGLEATLGTITASNSFRRFWLFGTTRETLFVWGSGKRVRDALEILPKAMHDWRELEERLGDLRQARRALLERADQERLASIWQRLPDRQRDCPTGRQAG